MSSNTRFETEKCMSVFEFKIHDLTHLTQIGCETNIHRKIKSAKPLNNRQSIGKA